MASRVSANDRFRLLELPDDVLANVLQRCPAGSIAGFPLPVALAQVRVTGSVDDSWQRPLAYLAARCPAVLNRVSPHLRSIGLLGLLSTKEREVMATKMTCLESLSARMLPPYLFPSLPTSLTKLRVPQYKSSSFYDLRSSEVHFTSLLRLTALEELEVTGLSGECPLGASLPCLRRLKCLRRPPSNLGTFAPNLEVLEAQVESEDVELLPSGLTELRITDYRRKTITFFQFPCTRLRSLGFYESIGNAELPGLVGVLTGLTRLEMRTITNRDLPQLVEALDNGREDLGLFVRSAMLYGSSSALKRLFGHLVEVKSLTNDNPASLPWGALTRLTRLVLEVDGRKDASWVQPLSQLPSLRDLEVELRGQVPAGFGALTQCTRLKLKAISNANLSCLQRLTRLRECSFSKSAVECLEALPDSLTMLAMSDCEISPDQLGPAIRHLTALEDLSVSLPKGAEGELDLSSLRRLTRLHIQSVFFTDDESPRSDEWKAPFTPFPLVQLGPQPCLRTLSLEKYPEMDDSFLRWLRSLPSLRKLQLIPGEDCKPVSLHSLPHLPLLEDLEGAIYCCRQEPPPLLDPDCY